LPSIIRLLTLKTIADMARCEDRQGFVFAQQQQHTGKKKAACMNSHTQGSACAGEAASRS